MSFTAESWAWGQRCANGLDKSVLVFLAFSANRDGGECFPSIQKIMDATQHTERSVRKAIASLIADGLITREARRTKQGRVTSPTYRLACSSAEIPVKSDTSGTYPQIYPQNAPAPAKKPPLNGVSAPAKTHPLEALSPCQNDIPAPAKKPPEPFFNLSKKERERASADLEGKQASKQAQDDPVPMVAAIEAVRKAEAVDLEALPSAMAAAFKRVLGLGNKTYAPGCPTPAVEVQLDRLNGPKRPKPAYLPPHLLANRARPVVRQPEYAL